MSLWCPFDALASVLIRGTCNKTEDKLLYLKPLWKFRSIDFSLWWIIFLSVRPSVAKREWVGTSRLFLLTLSLRAPSSPIPSSPLHSGQERRVGVTQETSSWATSLEYRLQSALELILITPPLTPNTHNNSFISTLQMIMWKAAKKISNLEIDHTLQAADTTFLSFPLNLSVPVALLSKLPFKT